MKRSIVVAVFLPVLTALAQTENVYLDALGSGWQNWSWSGTYTFNNPSPTYSGSASIAITQQAWGGLSLQHNSIASNAYAWLEFYIHGGTTGGQLLQARLEDDNTGTSSSALNLENYGSVLAGAWRLVSIPMADFALQTPNFTRIDIVDRTGTAQPTYYVDSITLSQTSSSPPHLTSVRASGSLAVVAFFDTAVTAASASSAANYQLQSPTDSAYAARRTASGAQYDASRLRVALTFASNFVVGAQYTLFVNHLTNLNNVAIAADSSLSFGWSNHTVNVNATASNHVISPLIYGVAWAPSTNALADIGATVHRWGGNHTSTYNWQIGAKNSANDWYFGNSAWTDGSAASFVNANAAAGAQTVMTMPMLQFIAKDATSVSFSVAKYGSQQATDPYRPDAGNGVLLNGSNVVNNPLDSGVTNTVAIQRQWLSNLVASAAAPQFVAMDNEMDIWSSTHRDWHPVSNNYDEMWRVFTNYAAMAKAMSPQSAVLGPVSCCWWYYWNSEAGANDKSAHGGEDFLPWFLDKAQQCEQQTGQRLLDVLDIHYYPDSFWNGGTNPAQQLRSTRELWDVTYTSEGWIGTDQWATQTQPNRNQPNLIPRFKTLIAQHYPGTKLALTEYNWGADTTLNGALAVADALGIFGREDLYLATYWTFPPLNSAAHQAFKLYHNFGNTSVSAGATEPNLFTAYAGTENSSGALTLVVINKNPAFDYNAQLQLTGFVPAPTANVYQVSAANPKAILNEPNITNASASFAYVFPAYSVTLLRFTPRDSDGDGLPDVWEQQFFGGATNANASADSDGDGFMNLQEFLAGTDPTNASSAFRIVSVTRSNVSFTTASNKLYRVERTDDLTSGTWTAITNNVIGTGRHDSNHRCHRDQRHESFLPRAFVALT